MGGGKVTRGSRQKCRAQGSGGKTLKRRNPGEHRLLQSLNSFVRVRIPEWLKALKTVVSLQAFRGWVSATGFLKQGHYIRKKWQREFQGNLRHGNVRKAQGYREIFRLLRRANALKGGIPKTDPA